MANDPNAVYFLRIGKTVARFVDPPAATGKEPEDRHRIRLWCNRVEEAALRLLDEHADGAGLVVLTREYFDELRAAAKKGRTMSEACAEVGGTLSVAPRPAHVLSLCSGVGMHDVGLGTVFHARTICYVEREAFAASQLVGLMEAGCLDQAPVWSDLATFDARPWRGVVDFLVAGLPCQPYSVAGKRKGNKDRRAFGKTTVMKTIDMLGGREVLCDGAGAREVIYGLVDPAEPARVRYVGRSRTPTARYHTHRKSPTRALKPWLAELQRQGRTPVMVLLERCEARVPYARDGTLSESEVAWVLLLRAQGQADLNKIVRQTRASSHEVGHG